MLTKQISKDSIEHRILGETAGRDSGIIRLEDLVSQLGTKGRKVAGVLLFLRERGLMTGEGLVRGLYGITPAGMQELAALGPVSDPKPELPPLATVVEHPGPAALDMNTGALQIGVYENGDPAYWQLWDTNGAHKAAVYGTTGAGTTNLLTGVLDATVGRPEIQVHVIDPGLEFRGDALRGVESSADTAAETRSLLRDIRDLMDQRSQRFCAASSRGWTGPSAENPLVLIMVAQMSHIPSAVGAILPEIAKMGRKLGISIIGACRTGTMDAWTSLTMRDEMTGTNGLLLRMVNPVAQAPSFPGLQMVPRFMEREFDDGSTTAGVGYDVTGRRLRAFYRPS